MDERRRLTEAEVEESVRFADSVLAAAGQQVDDADSDADIRAALRGEITYDEAVRRAIAGARPNGNLHVLRGQFFEVSRRPDEFIWLAILDEETQRFWVYDFDTECFHRNPGLTVDHDIDQELTYAPISPADARAIAATRYRGLGAYVARSHAADPDRVPAWAVLDGD